MANNGLALGGLDANNLFYNTTTMVAMLAGRYGLAALLTSTISFLPALAMGPIVEFLEQ